MAPLHAPKAQVASVVDYSGSVLQRLVVAYFLLLFAFVGVARAPMLARSEHEQPGSLIAAVTLRVQASTSARVSRSTQRVGFTTVDNEKPAQAGSTKPHAQDGPSFAVVPSCNCAVIATDAVSFELAFGTAPSARSEACAFLSRARAPPTVTHRRS